MRILKYTFGGTALGLVVALVFFALAGVLDVLGFFCSCTAPFSVDSCLNTTCYSTIQCTNSEYDTGSAGFDALMENPDIGFWTNKTARNVFGFCAIAGAIVGTLFGFAVSYSEKSDLAQEKRLRERAVSGDAEAQFQVGMKLLKENERSDEGWEWIRKAAAQGHLEAKAMTGDAEAMYEFALTISNESQQTEWLYKAAKSGYKPALEKIYEIINAHIDYKKNGPPNGFDLGSNYEMGKFKEAQRDNAIKAQLWINKFDSMMSCFPKSFKNDKRYKDLLLYGGAVKDRAKFAIELFEIELTPAEKDAIRRDLIYGSPTGGPNAIDMMKNVDSKGMIVDPPSTGSTIFGTSGANSSNAPISETSAATATGGTASSEKDGDFFTKSGKWVARRRGDYFYDTSDKPLYKMIGDKMYTMGDKWLYTIRSDGYIYDTSDKPVAQIIDGFLYDMGGQWK